MPGLEELEKSYEEARTDQDFSNQLSQTLTDLVGRPTPYYPARRLSERLETEIWLKREDLAHTGAHKINNAIGQALLAQRMGKTRIIAETGAGQHGVAVATAAAHFGLECAVYMGEVDMARQALNVTRMRILGTEVIPVTSGARTLKDAVSETLRDWAATVNDTHYIIGSVVGPHPFPWMVREFQKVIGEECSRQWGDHPPELAVACVGGGSNAMGLFYPLAGLGIELVGVEAGGEGLNSTRHGASLGAGKRGVLHGAMSMLLQDEYGRVQEAHSISAGLDYPGVGPEHSYFQAAGLARYVSVTDHQALAGVKLLSETEGIIPALESAHAIAWLSLNQAEVVGKRVLVNLSGRGDKDTDTYAAHF